MPPEIGNLLTELRKRFAKAIVGVLVVAVCAVAVTVFLCIGLFAWLQTIMPTWQAALLAATIVLLVPISAILLIARRAGQALRRHRDLRDRYFSNPE